MLLLGAVLLTGAQDAHQTVRFIACPVYRDTDNGRKSGCWLASDPATGIRYDVTAAPTKPDWNHAILVEGFVATNGGDPCGGYGDRASDSIGAGGALHPPPDPRGGLSGAALRPARA
ncbi:hypothetical protein LRS12_18315 [Sphingomonas sp. J344]|uniref:hypothetical protein n=1 Tax=Sphingomonas sp. J344 TaxID=2898434 RepID=UPI0021516229|nr:hypothetical protein [Sphingomonas sp. J344]MCR5872481.1 hypothetical protein [Sphingomonas sp. J344]